MTTNVADVRETDTQIIITRTFAAPRELVFAAFTKPEHLANWWGPTGFTITTYHHDASVGGVWRFTMHGPDGRDYENKVTFLEVAPPSRLVFKHGGSDDECESYATHTTTVQLDEVAGGTRLTFTAAFVDAAAKAFVVKNNNAVEGGRQTIGRLGEFLKTLDAAGSGPR